MYKKEFDKHLAQNSFANAVILFGESHFFIDRYAQILSQMPDASVLSMYHDEYDFGTAFAHLSQASLFNDASLLVIKTEKKVPKADLDKLVEACQKNLSNRFIYAYYGSDHKTCDKSFGAKAGGMSVRFFHPNYNDSIGFIAQKAAELNLQMDRYSINHLLQIHNNDIELASNELEKLALYDTTVTIDLINKLVYGLANVKMDKLLDDILSKNEFKENLSRLLESGMDEIALITSLSSYVTQLYLFNTYIRINGAPDSKAILGYVVPSFVLQAKAAFSLKFKPSQYFSMLDLLLDAQLMMKSGHADKEALLLSTLIKLQKIV
jgi:DNA polymerase III subunit delta